MPFDAPDTCHEQSIAQWRLTITFRAAATIACERFSYVMERIRSGSSNWGMRGSSVFQAVADALCRWFLGEESKGFQEPPDIHMHPEPMPWDYNDWRDHKGREVARHNYY